MLSPTIGEVVTVDKRSDTSRGYATLVAAHPITQTVATVYLDGRIKTSSGDTWAVKRLPNGKLRAVK